MSTGMGIAVGLTIYSVITMVGSIYLQRRMWKRLFTKDIEYTERNTGV
jgi:hypothetical protein